MNAFHISLLLLSVVAGSVASVTGFGIGSILTPYLTSFIGTKLAVALISIPHLIATSIRFYFIRAHINRKVLLSFGIASAIGGLVGALLYSSFQNQILSLILGVLLLFAGTMGFTGLAQKMRFHGAIARISGVLSGAFGGMVGNQGGIRSAALQSFDLPKLSLVATATAIGIIVDFSRMPIYLVRDGQALWSQSELILISCFGVVVGTFLGMKFLKNVSENTFRRILGAFIFVLGVYMVKVGLSA